MPLKRSIRLHRHLSHIIRVNFIADDKHGHKRSQVLRNTSFLDNHYIPEFWELINTQTRNAWQSTFKSRTGFEPLTVDNSVHRVGLQNDILNFTPGS
jgi:hypothetical protein